MPRSCRVRDISEFGMLLQYHSGSSTRFAPGHAVKVRLSLKENDARNVQLIPAQIRRIEDKGIAVEFNAPQTQLVKAVEPWMMDRAPAPALQHAVGAPRPANHTAAPGAPPHTHAHPPMPDTEPAAATRQPRARNTDTPTPAAPRPRSRGDYLAIVALALSVVALLLSVRPNPDTGLSGELYALRDGTREALEGLDRRIEDLDVSLAALEVDREIALNEQPVVIAATASATPDLPPGAHPQAVTSVEAASETPPAASVPAANAAARARAPSNPHAGPWVINLVSLLDAAASQTFAQRARALGIQSEVKKVSVNARDVWRVQVAGFETREAAERFSDAHKAELGLKTVWIFRQ